MTDREQTPVAYTVQVHYEPEGQMWAHVEELPGCFASGDTWEELVESLQEAIGLYISTPTQHQQVTITDTERAQETPRVEDYRVLTAAAG